MTVLAPHFAQELVAAGQAEGIAFTPDGTILGWDDLTPERQAAISALVAAHDPNTVPVPVPASVTPLQMRKALRAAGLKAQADAYAASLSEEAQEAWEYATVIMRNDPFIEGARLALGMTQAQADDLFRLADTL